MLTYDLYPTCLFVIDLVAQGRTLTSACREAYAAKGVAITPTRFRRAVAAAPELHEAYTDAQQQGYDTLAEILVEIDRDPHYGSSDAKMAKVISDNIKWLLSKRTAVYADKVQVEHKITADSVIIGALDRARQRAANIIDVTPVPVAVEGPAEDDATILAAIFS